MNHILFQFILLVSKLPLNFIYKITDGIIFFVFKVVGYRKKVVRENITNAFPEKSAKEIEAIIDQFYKNFSSLFAEMIKLFTISKEEHLERMKFHNPHELQKNTNHKNPIVLCGHIINWEMAIIAQTMLDSVIRLVYMSIESKFWDDKIYALRSKYGLVPLRMQETVAKIKDTPNDGKTIFVVVGDQSPHKDKAKYSLSFMGRETPIFVGYDFLAVEKDLNVFYMDFVCTKRGYYEATFHPILPDNGTKFEELEISRKFFKLLEATIKRDPANYLWTHKRWKHKRGVDY